MRKNCWICGKNADSGEHRYKKSDLKNFYGNKFKEPVLYFREDDNQMRWVQGADSKYFKYEKNLCIECNGSFTQPFDRAYDIFIDWIFNNTDYIFSRRIIDFRRIYGENFGEMQLNLFKYFAKVFGCELSDNPEFSIPRDILDIIYYKSFNTGFKVTFSITENIKYEKNLKILGKGEMPFYIYNNGDYAFSGHNYINWFNIHYWYLIDPEPLLGSEWIGNKQAIYLGSMEINKSLIKAFQASY